MRSSDRLSRLALVACDMAYAADKLTSGARPPLAPYDDSYPQNFRPGFALEQGFILHQIFKDPATGFKALLFTNNATSEAIIAFAGTDGLNAKDWTANSLHLGWNQWNENRHLVLPAVHALPNYTLHFTGQSLGGALAQYAAYDFLTNERSNPADINLSTRVTVTTFNGLGGTQALADHSTNGLAYSPLVLKNVSQQAAYIVTNDIVSLLGDGQAGMDVYRLDHRSTNLRPVSFPGGNSSYWNLNPVAAHRIEPGLYNALYQSRDFADAKLDPWYTPLAMTETQRAMKMWGAVFNTTGVYDRSANVRLGAAILAGAALGSRDEVNAFVSEIFRAVESAGALAAEGNVSIRPPFGIDEFQVDESTWAPVRRQLFEFLASADWSTASRLLASSPAGLRLYAGFIASAVGLERGLDQQVAQAYEVIAQRPGGIPPLRPLHWESGLELGKMFLQLLAPEWPVFQRLFSSGLISPDDFALAIERRPDKPFQEIEALLLGRKAQQLGTIGTDAAKARQLAEYAADVVLAMKEMQRDIAGIDRAADERVAAALEEFLDVDLGHAIVNRGDVLSIASLPRPSAFGHGELTAEEYRTLRNAFYAVAQDARYADARTELSDLVAEIEKGGELVALRPQRGNPFITGQPFAPHAIAAGDLEEGGVASFQLSLPYEAGEGGQRIKLAFSGADLSVLQLSWNGQSTALAATGIAEIVVAEGTNVGHLAIAVVGDVDADTSVSVSAQLLDSAGVASHESHQELNLSLDATVEPTTNPTSTKTGTTADDNRLGDAAHRPIVGTAAADFIRALAGRDEASGLTGDDLIEGGTGADILNGNDGADRMFADAVMDDATLRAYIASTATTPDATHATITLNASAADWLVGDMGDDTVVGSTAADILFGAGGADLIVGGPGHDIIDGDDDYTPGALTGVTVTRYWKGNPHEVYFSSANQVTYAGDVGAGDEVHAGAGDDYVTAQWGDDTVFGDNGDDTIAGGAGDDALFGGSGDDRITGDWYGTEDVLQPFGNDYIDGGAGRDKLNGEAGADVLVGGDGGDHLYGFVDSVFFGAPNEDPADDGADHLSGGAGIDYIVGHGYGDTLLGGDDDDQLFGDSDDTPVALQGDDYMDGGAGHDVLRGYGGNDHMIGGLDNDVLHGEQGHDTLEGGDEDDLLFGMDGSDTLDGGLGHDQLVGGAGNDRLFGGPVDDDDMWGEAGDDVIEGIGYLDGGDGNDTLIGGGLLFGMAGDDLLRGSGGVDQMLGGAGLDDLHGGGGADLMWGEADADTLAGEGDNDQLMGGDGSDALDGGDGQDRLFGEAGDDTLTGGTGVDYLVGGAGNDVYVVDGASGEDIIIDDEGQNTVRFGADVARDRLRFRRGVDVSGNDRYLVIEGAGTFSRVVVHGGIDGAVGRFEFADGTFITHAQAMAELATQAAPNRKPVGSVPATTRYGTTANDRIVGFDGDDTVRAGTGDDVVEGRGGRDTLEGYDGADRLDGGSGNDALVGGRGTDTYVFGRQHGRDTIEEQYLSPTGATEADTLELAAGVVPADVTLHRDGPDLVVAIHQTAAQIRVKRHFITQVMALNETTGRTELVPADHRIESIRFADGTTWYAAAIASRVQSGTQNAMTGTTGNDTFTVDHGDDTVSEAPGAGDDLVRSSVTYALRPHIERLTLTGFVDVNAWSTPDNAVSYLTGNAGNNVINGPGTYYTTTGSVTTSTGGGVMGYAVMAGGAGDDTYHLTSATGGQVIENAGEGYDTVALNGLGWTLYQLPANVEAIVSVEGTMAQTGVTLRRIGNALDNYIEGSKLDAFNPALPVNHIDGGAGADTMVGFGGDDVYIIDNAGDRVIDHGLFLDGRQRSTADEVRSSVAYELPDNVEILRLTGSAAIDGWGNDLANTLDGTSNAAVNRLSGGLGNDHYRANANDIVIERPGEGIDTIEWNGTGTRVYTPADLPQHVEALRLGDDVGDAAYDGDARSDRITGNAGHNRIDGGPGDDIIDGGGGSDLLTGGPGNDWITPGQGHDYVVFSRGFGQDIVFTTFQDEIQFDSTIAFGDIVFTPTELRIAGTSDAVRLIGTNVGMRFADGTYLTPGETAARMDASDSTTPTTGNDTLTGTAGADTLDGLGGDDFIYGLGGDDTLSGGTHNDEIRGGDGHDTVRGDSGNDKLFGDRGNDRIDGNDGNDWIDGGLDNDTLDGGLGDDTVRGGDGDDRLVGGGGQDNLDGGVGNDVLDVGAGSGTLIGGAGDDRLTGGTGFDLLSGGDGNDRLQGGAAIDGLSGGAGIDTVVFESGGGYDYFDDLMSGELTIVEIAAPLTPADITLSRVGDEFWSTVYVSANAGADMLEMRLFGNAANPIEIRFADGTIWTPAIVQDRLARVEGTDFDDSLTGTAQDDRLYGLAGNDTLSGLAGNDLLDGGSGADWLEGGEGDDRYVVDDPADAISEFASEGIDSVESTVSTTLAANVENLTLTGAALNGTGNTQNNTITGNAAANILDGRQGADTLIGGAGNDSYVIDSAADVIIENAGEGVDTVTSSVTHTLGTNFEHLTLSGSAAVNATGNALANTLSGNVGANVLDGKAGADTLRGGAGNDTYVIDTLADILVENAGEGTDTVQSALTFTLATNFENLTLTGSAAINGTGNAAANVIIGNAAANVLNGGGGSDSLRGGAGNDSYVVDATSDAIVENAGEGTDAVSASVSYTLAANVENLTLAGTSAINGTGNALANTLTGNAAANTLNGGLGNDTMRGGAGNDVYIVDAVGDIVVENAAEGTDTIQSSLAWTLGANVENLTLTGIASVNATGNALANALTGNAGANVLDGGAGADTLSGGAGNDTYVVDHAADVVIEAAAAGTDLVRASVSTTLAANVENLTLTGTAAINGTGNALANALQGNGAANVLDGGAGADSLRGGAGNDVLVVDNSADVVVENAAEGDDTVRSYIAWTLGANLENLTLVGSAAVDATGNAVDNWLQGNLAANALSGGDGQDLVFGAAGNDTLSGGNGRDILQGGDGDDSIGDTAGNNLLHGGLGIDTLVGGSGNELFAGGAGNDLITLGTGADLIAFNRGDGQDIVSASTGVDNTLSLGGGIRYADIALRKSGNDLVVAVGVSEQLTLKDWYLSASNRHVIDLQMIVDASSDWNAASTNALSNRRVARFDFAGLVTQFDAARAADPLLTQWSVAGALASEHLGGSDTAALGGDLAYQYGHANALTGIGWTPADGVLASASFGTALQTLQTASTLFAGAKRLA